MVKETPPSATLAAADPVDHDGFHGLNHPSGKTENGMGKHLGQKINIYIYIVVYIIYMYIYIFIENDVGDKINKHHLFDALGSSEDHVADSF